MGAAGYSKTVAGRILHAALPRLDDRRRLGRDAEEPHRRARVRPPLRPAPAEAEIVRGGGVTQAAGAGAARAAVGRDHRAVERCDQDRRPAAEISAAGRLCRPRLSDQSAARRGAGRARLAVARRAAGGARARLCRRVDRGDDGGDRGMRAARRAGGHRARQRLLRDRRRRRGARGADPRRLLQGFRHAPGRAVEPRRRRSAAQDVPHRQRRVRRAGPAGRPHLRGVAFRRHDRHVPVARQGARHPLRRPRLGRQRGRSFDRRDLRGDARRSRHRRLRAVPRNHAQGAGAARLRAGGRQARQAGAGLQARPLGRGARACGLAHRRARRRGRHRRHVPRRMRHRPRRHAGRTDRGLSAAGARAGRRRARRRPAVAVVTTTAGGATMVVDPLATRGIAVEPPTPQTLARIKAATGVDVAPARHRSISRSPARSTR